jgi:4-alpha-glucanotransferase
VTDAWGIADGYYDVEGEWHDVLPEARDALRAAMGDPPPQPAVWVVHQGETNDLWNPCVVRLEDGTQLGPLVELPPDLPLGYHDLAPLDGTAPTFLMVAPARIRRPHRVWGLAVQVSSLWSSASQGIGDLADLRVVIDWLASWGGGAVLLSPLAAPVLVPPLEGSPYFPSTRRFVTPLHLRVPGAPAVPPRPAPDGGPALAARDAVWAAKQAALRACFDQVRDAPGWRAWADAQGISLRRYAAWCATAEVHGGNWHEWPDALRAPGAFDGASFDDPAVAFHAWCQWLADRQLAEVHRGADDVALVGDLPVGFAPDGFDAWEYQEVLAHGCRIGAPPDTFSRGGQDWGLPPFVPAALRARRFEPLRETVRACLRHVDGLRIDHVMGLFRQWWVPPDADAAGGAYVRFPAAEMLAVVAIEAARAGAFVVGEDLGTVEAGVPEALADWGVLGTRVLWFEDVDPDEWPEASIGTVATHDLPTATGAWRREDGHAGLVDRISELTGLAVDASPAEVVVALHRVLAGAPAVIRLATLEDVCGAPHRPNVPGTVNEVNWNRRLPLSVEQLVTSPLAAEAIRPLAQHEEAGS